MNSFKWFETSESLVRTTLNLEKKKKSNFSDSVACEAGKRGCQSRVTLGRIMLINKVCCRRECLLEFLFPVFNIYMYI